MFKYKVLGQDFFWNGSYSLVPIRNEDRYSIMKWRNEQIYHLRQTVPLTPADQDRYFSDVVSKLFEQERPNQLLFSYLENGVCIGYGGLVHINWVDQNAEISFIMDTAREKNEFYKHWCLYLQLIENMAFNHLGLHKIYTYAFDLRPHLYPALEHSAFKREAVLEDHCLFNQIFGKVVIHAKLNLKLGLRRADKGDLDLTYRWAIDPEVRKYSLSTHTITLTEHSQWFINKLRDVNCLFFIAEISGVAIGSIRFDIENGEALISYLIVPEMHGKGYGKHLLHQGVSRLFEESEVNTVKGIVLEINGASVKTFEGLGYQKLDDTNGRLTFIKARLV